MTDQNDLAKRIIQAALDNSSSVPSSPLDTAPEELQKYWFSRGA